MKFTSLKAFDRELRQLPKEHQRLFLATIHRSFLPAVDAGAFSGTPPWPTRLRIHKLEGYDVYSLTWNFASPDGRATFHVQKDEGGDPLLVWRRIGDHSIYKGP